MNAYKLDNNIYTICVRAHSFPDGITDAFERLKNLVPDTANRTLYGISRPENGNIIYRAAVSAGKGEAEEKGAENFTIKTGNYITETPVDWETHKERIGDTFQTLLAYPGIDPDGACIEWYQPNGELVCMVRLNN
ncbi:MAG: hypothetical protein ACTHJ0_06630 [Flavipsychrobacter sp.]